MIPDRAMHVSLECCAWVYPDRVYLRDDDGWFVVKVEGGKLVTDATDTRVHSPWTRLLAFDGEDE